MPSTAGKRPADEMTGARPRADIPTDLINRCQSGDGMALRELFETIVEDVHQILHRLAGPDPDHEDMCQEALLAVHHALPRFRHESAFRTWMYSICTRIALGHLKRRRRMNAKLEGSVGSGIELDSDDDDPERSAILKQQAATLQQTLDRMKPKKRAAYLLCDIEGLPVEDVATIVGTSRATVHTRLHHARKELRRALARHQAMEMPA